MDDWIDYYDSTHTIYANKLHRDVHFQIIARDITRHIPAKNAVVLDYACGEALSAAMVAAQCGTLILAEPAPGVRARLSARFTAVGNIKVHSLDELRDLPERSLDLAMMNSVSQYMTPDELDIAFRMLRRLLKPGGKLVLGDVLQPDVGMFRDAAALLHLAYQHGFLKDAVIGLLRTALSDYRELRTRIGLQRYTADAMLAKLAASGFRASRTPVNFGHNRWRMTFEASPAPND